MTLGELWQASPFACILFMVFTPYGIFAAFRDLVEWQYPIKVE